VAHQPVVLVRQAHPLYNIRDEDFAIERFYRRATDAEAASASRLSQPISHVQYLRTKYPVLPASKLETERVDRWLLLLRILGVCFTVFLLAAINALTRS
jgi:hypothetical protein